MPFLLPSAMRLYKLCALIGTLIILLDIGYSWVKIKSFENSVTEVFEGIVRTQLEVDGLQQELNHINKVLELAEGKDLSDDKQKLKVDDMEYSAYEVEHLKGEQGNVRLYVQEKQLDLESLNNIKKHVMNEVRVLFLISLVFLVIGTLLAAFGYLAWYFKVELFEERRKKPRN